MMLNVQSDLPISCYGLRPIEIAKAPSKSGSVLRVQGF